jgi:hypothetical protein
MTRTTAIAIVLVTATVVGEARADEKQQCVDAYKQAQVLRKKGDYNAAREHLLVCSRESCPAMIKQDCVPWLGEIARGIASMVVLAQDPSGRALEAVTVTVDGRVVTEHLDGRPIELSPGTRTIRFEAQGAPAVERSITLKEGEKNHAVEVVLAVPPPSKPDVPPPPVTRRPIPGGAIALATVGVLGFGTFATLGLMGLGKRSSLDLCRPTCNPADVDVVRAEFIAADVAVAIGSAALVGATIWFFLRPEVAEQATTVAAAPLPGGGLFTLRRAF